MSVERASLNNNLNLSLEEGNILIGRVKRGNN
jgi:hypothetical protein